jgi:hypothetical protein
MKTILALVLLAAASACATASPAPAGPAPLEPVGRFEFTTTAQGQPVTGAIVITGEPGAYLGTISTSATPDIPVTGVAVEDREMRVSGDTPDGPIALRLVFVGDEFTGDWEFSGMTGELAGRRTQ